VVSARLFALTFFNRDILHKHDARVNHGFTEPKSLAAFTKQNTTLYAAEDVAETEHPGRV
jgi:hypothetical protein